jgi:transposase InsO family protein
MQRKKKQQKQQLQEQARSLFYNKQLSNQAIAESLGCSVRTIIRWKQQATRSRDPSTNLPKHQQSRQRKYVSIIFDRMCELKTQNPNWTVPIIHQTLAESFETCPSESSIRKYLVAKGFRFKHTPNRQGYIKFQRDKPNELWQIDIAGPQSLKGLGVVYLILIVDDCSRFVVSAQYFQDQKVMNVLQVIRNAVMEYGRPQEMFSDNGRQFKSMMGEQQTRYVNLLYSLDIKPSFSRRQHPQSKGKVERIFETVNKNFLLKLRAELHHLSHFFLYDLNTRLQQWVKWYNEQKPHRSLPQRKPPITVFQKAERIYRPLESQIDWNQWINAYIERKVTKYNEITYQTQTIKIPPGYVGCRIQLLHLDDRFEIYHQDQLISTVLKTSDTYSLPKSPIIRTIAQNGTVQYQKHWYSVDYKLRGKKVEIQANEDGRTLLVYLEKILIKRLSVK